MVAAHFENQISDTARWHSVLLQRMSQEIPGIRPAVLSQESYLLLNSLRGFRHFSAMLMEFPLTTNNCKLTSRKLVNSIPILRTI